MAYTVILHIAGEPSIVGEIEELPKTTVGKILRRALRDESKPAA